MMKELLDASDAALPRASLLPANMVVLTALFTIESRLAGFVGGFRAHFPCTFCTALHCSFVFVVSFFFLGL